MNLIDGGMSMIKFYSFHGIVTMINDFMISAKGEGEGCYKLMSVEDGQGATVNFMISPTTYFVEQEMVSVGDKVTGYYDGNAPAILIYPPQFTALVMVKDSPHYNVKVDFFNSQLVSSDEKLKLNISAFTQIVLPNGQPFSKIATNRNLIVLYGPSTKSIPAQTNPYKIIVWC